MSSVIELTPQNYKNGRFVHPLLKNKFGMVFVGAEWCNFCKRLKPVYYKVANTMGAQVFPMCHIEATKYPDLVKTLRVNSFPTVWYVKDGKIIKDFTAERTPEAFLTDICTTTMLCKK